MLGLVDADTHLPDKPLRINHNGYLVFKQGSKDYFIHRWIVEKAIGRFLKGDEVVHHVNYNKLDNRRENLVVCKQNYHMILHARTDMINKGYNPNTHHTCSSCKDTKLKELFPKNKSEWNGVNHYCKDCSNSIRRIKQYSKGKFNWLSRLQQQYRRIASSYTKRDICWITKEGNCP